MKIWFLIIGFFFSYSANAVVRLDVDTEIGRGFFASNIGLSQYFPVRDNEIYFSQWNVSAGANQSKYEDVTTGQTTVTRGRQGSLGVGVGYDKKWNLDLGLFANSTPETQFGEAGSFGQCSYSLKNIADSDFGFSLGVGRAQSKIGQKISFRILNTTVNRDVELDKNESSFYLGVYAFRWLSLRLDYQIYSYSRSKADLQAAYASRFLNYYTSDLVNSIGGLPENTASLGVIIAALPDWDFSLSIRKTHLIVDDSDSQKTQLSADRYFEKWTGGFGFSRSETNQGLENSLLARFSVDL